MYKTTRRIECSDIAIDNKLRLSAALDLLQDCAYDHLQNDKTLKPFFEKDGNVMFLVYRQVDFFRRPVYNEIVAVKTWCYELKRMYGYRNTTITDAQGQLCMRDYEIGAFAQLSTSRPVKIPQELADMVEKHEKLDMEYTKRKIDLPAREPDITDSLKVYLSFIDMYGHVNNARYAELSEEYVRAEKELKTLRIEYKTPLKKDNGAGIKVWNEQGSDIISIINGSGEDCCILEYVYH